MFNTNTCFFTIDAPFKKVSVRKKSNSLRRRFSSYWTFASYPNNIKCDSFSLWFIKRFLISKHLGWWHAGSERAKVKTNLPPHVTVICRMWPPLTEGCWKTCRAHQTSGCSALRGFKGKKHSSSGTRYIPTGKSSPTHYQILTAGLLSSKERRTRCQSFCNGIARRFKWLHQQLPPLIN